MIDLRGSIYFQINAEAWNFFKSSLPAQNSDQYWASVLAYYTRLKRQQNQDTATYTHDKKGISVNSRLNDTYNCDNQQEEITCTPKESICSFLQSQKHQI